MAQVREHLAQVTEHLAQVRELLAQIREHIAQVRDRDLTGSMTDRILIFPLGEQRELT